MHELNELAAESLEGYLANVVIDSRPEPLPWHQCIEPWQVEIAAPLIPAIEQMAGIRKDYSGPRSFWYTLPRGHDKTGLIGRIANWACGYSRNQIRGIGAATDGDQAALLADSMVMERNNNSWLLERIEPKRNSMSGPGGNFKIITSDAPSSSGLKCDLIVCDEITWWKKRDLFDVLYSGREKRPNSVFIVITNAGMRGSWQWDILQEAKRNPESWHVYEAPQRRMLASWMDAARVDELQRILSRGITRRVLWNEWIDATEMPLLTLAEILACESQDSLWGKVRPKLHHQGDLYIGVDIGRTKHLTVIWVLEVDRYGVAWTREVVVLDKVPLAQQKAVIKSRINRKVVRVNIDMGGIGYQLTEELVAEHRGIVEGVSLSSGRQGQLGVLMKSKFESRGVMIPYGDEDLRRDLQQVEEVYTGPGGVPVIQTGESDIGHADRFWALALALYGLPHDAGPKYHRPPMGFRSRYSGGAGGMGPNGPRNIARIPIGRKG